MEGKHNVKMEQLSLTNKSGMGLLCPGTNIDVTECCFKKCQYYGVYVHKGANFTATSVGIMECVSSVVPLLLQHDVILWRMVNLGFFVMVPIQK